jgi:FlaA1/EpsC-like NDP-sugar epimerase
MGQPIKILDLAHRMIQLSGLEPHRDIEIVYTGIRPGERLNEILFAREEPTSEIGIAGIVAAKPVCPSLEAVRKWLILLEQGVREGQRSLIYSVIRQANPDFPDERVASDAAMKQVVGR